MSLRPGHTVRRLSFRWLIGLLAILLGGAGGIQAQDSPPPPGRLIDLGGYRLHLFCTGQGTPTVVLSPGAGDFSFDWALVQPEVAKFARVCSYDRAGEAWSQLGPRPRTLDQEVYDLHRLLRAAGEKPPFLLVGHSQGGMVARLFAERYRPETAGLVLVEALTEDARLYIRGKLIRLRTAAQARAVPAPRDSLRATDALGPDELKGIRDFMKQVVGTPTIDPPFDRLPSWAQQDQLWAYSRPEHYAGGDDYLAEIAARLYAEDQAVAHPLGDMPLLVLERTRDEYPSADSAALSREHREQQRGLAALSTAGKLERVAGAGHHIQLDQPEAVVEAIRAMLRR